MTDDVDDGVLGDDVFFLGDACVVALDLKKIIFGNWILMRMKIWKWWTLEGGSEIQNFFLEAKKIPEF